MSKRKNTFGENTAVTLLGPTGYDNVIQILDSLPELMELYDALIAGGTGTLIVDQLSELTPDNGIVVDALTLIKDGNISSTSFNDVALTALGLSTQFLGADGVYQTLVETDISNLDKYTQLEVDDKLDLKTNIADLDQFTHEIHATQVHLEVKNISGGDMVKGQPVKFVSYNVGQDIVEITLADQATDVSIGLLEEDILNNATGGLIVSGILHNVDTSLWAAGTILYVDGAGVLTPTRPVTGYMQPIAFVLRQHASIGHMQVLAAHPLLDAAATRYAGTLTATDVAAALDELDAALGAATYTIEGLTDTNVVTPAVRHALMWDGTDSWDNRLLVEADISDLDKYTQTEVDSAISAAVTAMNEISELTDTNVITPAVRHALMWDGVDSWDNRLLVEADISDLDKYTQTQVDAAITAATASMNELSELTDTVIATPAVRHALMYDGVDSWDNRLLVEADISDLQTYSLDGHTHAYIPTSEKAAANGVATLGADSLIPNNQLPALAITATFSVASEVAQLALTVQEGDVAVRTDENKSYIALNATNATMADWQELLAPTDAVTSVDGRTGVVTLSDLYVGFGGGAFTGQILLSDGTTGAPSLAFSSNTDVGLQYAAGTLNLIYDGGIKVQIGSAGVYASTGSQFLGDKATTTEPGFAFVGAIGTGLSADNITGGTLKFSVAGAQYMQLKGSALQIPAGTVGTPGLSTSTDPDTGIFFSGTDVISIVSGGTARLQSNTSGIAIAGTISGSASYPGIYLTSTNTGTVAGADGLQIADHNGYARQGIWNSMNNTNSDFVDRMVLTIKDATNVTVGTFGWQDGNIDVSGAAPVDDNHLTRKDYVDATARAHNVIINGNFDVWQRGTTFTAVVSKHTADRFVVSDGCTGVITVSRSTSTPTYAQSGVKSNYSLKVDVTTADASVGAAEYAVIEYNVEGYDYAQIAGDDATLSFWVRAAKTGIHCLAFRNSANNRTYVTEYTVNTADTWEKKTVTVPLTETGGTWNYVNGRGLNIVWSLLVGTDNHTTKDTWQSTGDIATSNQVNELDNVANNFYIAQVQLERGSTATPFELRSFDTEVSLCQRYFQKSYDLLTAPGTATVTGASFWRLGSVGNHAAVHALRSLERMCKTPTVDWYSTSSGTIDRVRNNSGSADYTVTANTGEGEKSTGVPTLDSTGGTVGNQMRAHWIASAEI